MILFKIDTPRIAFNPLKRDPPGAVDRDRVSLGCRMQRVQTETRKVQVLQRPGLMQGIQDTQRPLLKVRPHSDTGASEEQIAQTLVAEAL